MVEGKLKNIGKLTTPNLTYQIIRTLGEGTTSKVYLCKRETDGELLALKIFKT